MFLRRVPVDIRKTTGKGRLARQGEVDGGIGVESVHRDSFNRASFGRISNGERVEQREKKHYWEPGGREGQKSSHQGILNRLAVVQVRIVSNVFPNELFWMGSFLWFSIFVRTARGGVD